MQTKTVKSDAAKRKQDRVTMTISLSKSVKVGLKVYAASNGTTVSGLIEKWFHENCEK